MPYNRITYEITFTDLDTMEVDGLSVDDVISRVRRLRQRKAAIMDASGKTVPDDFYRIGMMRLITYTVNPVGVNRVEFGVF